MQMPIVSNGELEQQAVQNTLYLIHVLNTGGQSAQREWAASRLRVVDTRNPYAGYVVDALANAAKSDTAPMVRASAVQSLAQMRATQPAALAAIQGAAQDPDPRVRDEAMQALQVLNSAGVPGVQPAAYYPGQGR
jgi:HEAT repeat protein